MGFDRAMLAVAALLLAAASAGCSATGDGMNHAGSTATQVSLSAEERQCDDDPDSYEGYDGTASYGDDARTDAATLHELLDGDGKVTVIDVRKGVRSRIPGSRAIPAATLADRLDEVPSDGMVAIVAAGQDQASVAWDALEGGGGDMSRVIVLDEGLDEWEALGYEVRETNEC